ncbi:MAG TPA: DUF4175 family protein [Gemmataceae bacterium]|nr:DUF4175 family protein [Gemmataceae bacterium]
MQVQDPPRLLERLEDTRQEMHAFRRARCLLRVGLVVLVLAGLLAAADWLFVLNTALRGLGLVVLAGVALYLLARGLFAPGRHFGRQDAAAEVESAFPQLGQRIRTTLEYADPTPRTAPATPGLVRALAADTGQRTRGLDFRGLVPWRSLRWLGVGLAGLAVVFLVLLARYGELRTAALRLFLLPAHYTQLQVKPGDQAIKVGSDLAVETTLSGRPVRNADLLYRPTGSADDWTKVSLAPPDAAPSQKLSGTLQTSLKNCQNDVEYRVVAGPVESPTYHVTILRPLVLKQVEATVEAPAYTRRPVTTVKEGNFKVIAGSRVRFQFTLDREPRAARLVFLGSDHKPLDLHVGGKQLTGELTAVAKDVDYEIAAEAADGMRLDPARFRIGVQPDRKPTVRFTRPQDQIEVTPSTEVHMKVEAADDFGLSAVGVVFQVGSGPKQTLFLRRDPDQPTTFKAEVVLPLEDQQVGFQDGVTYYAYAEDNHPDKAQRGTTELQFIDIRPYKRDYQMLETGGS